MIENVHLEEVNYKFLETHIPNLKYMDAEKPLEKHHFLTSRENQETRAELLETLEFWEDILESHEALEDIVASTKEKIISTESIYQKNLKRVVNRANDLEVAYKGLTLFFENAQAEKINNLSILNADLDQLKDLDNPIFIEVVRDAFVDAYDRLDLCDHYALLVIPGYLGSPMVLDKWSKIAHDNKVLLVTDFAHLDTPDDVVEVFETIDHVRADTYLSNTIMTCNWLVGRGKYDAISEHDDLFLPPSSSLSGKIYSNKMSQASAGIKFGALSQVGGVSFDLKKNDLAALERLGLIPMVYKNGEIIAYSAKTLFNGDNLGLQTYSVVRVFDYVSKVLIDYFNRKTFENFNVRTRRALMQDIVDFLDRNTGPQKLIESFAIKRLEQDMQQKDRVHLELHMEPYFPAKNFLIRMDGKIGDSGKANSWEAAYEQG
ncbi:type VI secretion system contractile sheath protein TssC [Tamlana sp. 2_MG-2023]|uniref:type VI secretion system contractile sheath protein TssC n=1 Tax=unclassified Tamlana TaxID=2614803 RepID=UPI0026E1B60E|nr:MULTISPECIES: type VI secretion system contractile sheath protein TssC [unclassified Tamlana]MDO6761518.1 type VI secretion system contractile sheath protein TssC [Tamlana sp. 2_MG-2023]MDO6792388.1 type VI secretion system contractile sheath protein TssC [Tamlana sp. 1_MG-2023]